ncbi:TetR/AcrR family transcriptional regulator [Psychrobacillus vulpis]|uniref:TetR/AcrR family transcriptional regulator n=1 Tax=Psychrobacillus vulpis TaxID=2325572 RepID=A0A544TFL3_9BACI|nr:TetR/AcrR family transcriptional regulator [Psychrobacillus vulpis]TQR16208.1 TetR/AcrR family transcriptional regulator [Psychrobacillus vulpis]
MNSRKKNVLLAAQRLFIEKGFSSTSVQDIIEEAKISKGTFYNYFSSKNECIVAILENVKEETSIKRRELLVQQNDADLNILVEQMTIRMNIYQDQNLYPIIVSIIHSQDLELRDLVKMNYLEEVNWLAKRLVDIFGEQTKDIAVDCSVLVLGMIQQLQHPWIRQYTKVSTEKIIRFVMRRIETIIYEMARTNDSLLKRPCFELNTEEKLLTKDEISKQLESFYLKEINSLKLKEIQMIEYILEELNREQPRKFLLEKIVPSLTEAFTNTSLEHKSTMIIYHIWKFLDRI